MRRWAAHGSILYSVVSQFTMSLVASWSPRLVELANSGWLPTLMMCSLVSTRGPVRFDFLAQLDRELYGHRRFDAGSGRLAIALQRMAIADEQQRARMIDREDHSRAFADFVVVEIAAVGA